MDVSRGILSPIFQPYFAAIALLMIAPVRVRCMASIWSCDMTIFGYTANCVAVSIANTGRAVLCILVKAAKVAPVRHGAHAWHRLMRLR